MTSEEFRIAVSRNSHRLFLIAFSFTKSTYDAEDIVQNVFLKLWKYDKEFADREHIDKWLTAVCVNESKNCIKSVFRSFQNIEDCQLASPDCFGDSSQQELFNAVMELPKKYRTAVHLFYYEDLPIKEIAELLGVKESAVKTRLSRARTKIKERLGERIDE
ncbi:MAG: RNA polymerase sigma factor [Clostridia bacterium]|nr:RNA polymerase sigma factor [Clostridia bacterium]